MNHATFSNRKIILMLSIALLLMLILNCWFLFFINASKIVYVDGARILHEYKYASEDQSAFEEKLGQWKKNIDTLQSEFDFAYLKFEREEKQLNGAAKEQERERLSKQRKQLDDYKAAIEQNTATENAKITQERLIAINKFLLEYGKKKRYKFILIANQVGTIAYAEEGLDKTDEVLKALNDAK